MSEARELIRNIGDAKVTDEEVTELLISDLITLDKEEVGPVMTALAEHRPTIHDRIAPLVTLTT